MSKIKCNTCGKLRTRLPDGKIAGQVAWKDQNGRRWNRRKCPPCFKDYQLAHRKKRPVRELIPIRHKAQTYVAPGTRLRNCQTCGDNTPNYYHCQPCYNRMKENDSIGLLEADYYTLHGGC